MSAIDFDKSFHALTGNLPFPWQTALYDRFVSERAENIPASCNLPTGLGKTAVIAVWLIALASHPTKMPRRLVYVVNRRTVVDQTTTEVEQFRDRLAAAGLVDALRALCVVVDPLPFSISTLRGQFADNRAWLDPAAREPHGEAVRIVIPAVAALRHRQPSKLAAPDYQC